jgi:putative ABC transport system permease protein
VTELLTDLRLALRTLRRSPGFTLAAVATLALGIGANTAIFSVFHGILLRPLDYAEPDRLVTVWEDHTQRSGPPREWTGRTVFSTWRERSSTLEHLTAFTGWAPDLTGVELPEALSGARVSHGFFTVLGRPPVLGRGFEPADEVPDNGKVIVLSDGLWRRRFGADPAIVGRSIVLNAVPHTVVGIAAPDFVMPFDRRAELWTPLAIDPSRSDAGNCFLRTFGRLKAGASLTAAQAELARVAEDLRTAHPEDLAGVGAAVEPLQRSLTGSVRPTLTALLAGVGLVFLIACANVGGLLLARAQGRGRELAVRAALGAGAGRLLRQLLAESLLLATAGACLGVALAAWILEAIRLLGPDQFLDLAPLRLDGPVLAYAVAIALASSLLCGLAPAWGAVRRSATARLSAGRGSGTTTGAQRLREGLVVLEIALGIALLFAAGLVLKTASTLAQVDPGFRPETVTAARLNLPVARLPEEHQLLAALSGIEQAVGAMPGVQSVGATSTLPLAGGQLDLNFEIENRRAEVGREPLTDVRVVTPGYFQTVGIPLLEGRAFGPDDLRTAVQVAVVSERFAQVFFPGERVLGKRVRMGTGHENRPWLTIVGVVGGVRDNALDRVPDPELYAPFAQTSARSMSLVVRSSLPTELLAVELRRTIAAIDRDQVVAEIVPMSQLVAHALAPRRFTSNLLGGFALLALALAAVGLYSVIAYVVGTRRREIGLRMALGARREQVAVMVLRWGARLFGLGLAVGALLALGLGHGIAGLLYGVDPTDPAVLATAAAVLAATAAVACWLPARSASRTEPQRALADD